MLIDPSMPSIRSNSNPIEIYSVVRVAQSKRVYKQWHLGESEFAKILQAGAPVLKIATTVGLARASGIAKAAFPLNLEADHATYEILWCY